MLIPSNDSCFNHIFFESLAISITIQFTNQVKRYLKSIRNNKKMQFLIQVRIIRKYFTCNVNYLSNFWVTVPETVVPLLNLKLTSLQVLKKKKSCFSVLLRRLQNYSRLFLVKHRIERGRTFKPLPFFHRCIMTLPDWSLLIICESVTIVVY